MRANSHTWPTSAEVRLVAQLWLRSGNSTCGSNVTAFFLDLWENLPRQIRLRGVRADSGFCLPELLCLWEELALPYVVVAQLSQPIQKILKGQIRWQPHWLFITAGVISHPGGKTTVKLAVPKRERGWWRRLWGKILSPWPNCNAVENRPVFSAGSE